MLSARHLIIDIEGVKGVLFMEKIIDFNKSLLELSKEYPEVIEIMKYLGFNQIAMPGMLSTVGRFMTIPKGAASKGIPIEKIKEVFESKGYKVLE